MLSLNSGWSSLLVLFFNFDPLATIMSGLFSQGLNLDFLTGEGQHAFSSGNLAAQGDIQWAFKNIQGTYKKYIRSWWETASLSTYHQQKLIYRGLRINLTPHSFREDQLFIQNWQAILSECSGRLISLLLDFEQKRLQESGKQLEKELKEIQNFQTHSDFVGFEQKLQNNIINYNKEIKERKQSKYLRDQKDFETGNIYIKKGFSRVYQSDYSESETSDIDDNSRSRSTFPNRKRKEGFNKKSFQRRKSPYNRERVDQGFISTQRCNVGAVPLGLGYNQVNCPTTSGVSVSSLSSLSLQQPLVGTSPNISLASPAMPSLSGAGALPVSSNVVSTALTAPVFLGSQGHQLRPRPPRQ